jgi:hypothetical protein
MYLSSMMRVSVPYSLQEKHKLSLANLIYVSLKKADGRNTISVGQDKPMKNNITSIGRRGADKIYISFCWPGWGPMEVQTFSPPCVPGPAVPRAHKFIDPPLLPPVDDTRRPWSSTTPAATPFSTNPTATLLSTAPNLALP